MATYLLDSRDEAREDVALRSRRDIASHLGVTPETLSRVLGQFRDRRWVVTARHRIRVEDPDSLGALVAG